MTTLYDMPYDIKDIIYDKKYKAEYNDVIEELKSNKKFIYNHNLIHLKYDDLYDRLLEYCVFTGILGYDTDEDGNDNIYDEQYLYDVLDIDSEYFYITEHLINKYNLK